jgi:hypothetical protein
LLLKLTAWFLADPPATRNHKICVTTLCGSSFQCRMDGRGYAVPSIQGQQAERISG